MEPNKNADLNASSKKINLLLKSNRQILINQILILSTIVSIRSGESSMAALSDVFDRQLKRTDKTIKLLKNK
jgi:hypothetical protein